MIEIKGNFGKSIIFEHLMNSSTVGLILGRGFPVYGDNIYVMNDEEVTTEEIIKFIEEYFTYDFNAVMIYSNWDYEKIKPIIEYCKEQNGQRQYIIFYKQ